MLVEIEGAFTGIGSTANIAYAGFGIVILHMCRIIRLNFEHFPTLFASVIIIFRMLSDMMDFEIRFGTSFKIAEGTRVKLCRFGMYLHMPGEIRTGFETLGANSAFMRPRITVFEHVARELTLAKEGVITNLTGMRTFFNFARLFGIPE